VSALGGGPGDVAPGRAVNGIALGRTLCGVGGVAMVVIQGKVLADWFQGRGFLLAISVSVGAYPIGVGLGQLTQPPLAEAFGWPAAFLAGGTIQAMSLALFLASFRVPPHNVAQPRRLVLPSGRECLLTALAGLVWATYTAGYTGFLSYAPSLMADRGESMALTGVVIAIASWGSVPPTVFGAGLANRYGGFRIVLIGTGAVVLGITGSALTDWPILWAVILGVIGQVHPGVIQAIGTLSTRTETRAAGMGIFYCLYYAGGTVVPALCGVAADRAGGPSGALLCAAAVSALGIPAYMLHRRLVSHATMLARA
jgi:MFS family permease